ncbi:MAG: pilin [bacterium]
MELFHQVLRLLASPVNAASASSPSIPNVIDIGSIGEFITRISNFVQPVAIVALIACVIGAGFVRLTSAGNSEKEAQSMKILTSAAIGFAIIALAPLIVNILTTLLKVNSNIVTP